MDFNGRVHKEAEKRRRQMRRLRAAGWSNVEIAHKYGISRERVRQILGKA